MGSVAICTARCKICCKSLEYELTPVNVSGCVRFRADVLGETGELAMILPRCVLHSKLEPEFQPGGQRVMRPYRVQFAGPAAPSASAGGAAMLCRAACSQPSLRMSS